MKVTKEIPREETNGLMGQTDIKTTYEEGYKGNTKGRNKWTDGTD